MGLTARKKANSMERVLNESLHYFEKNGYYNTTIEDLCKEAMISRSTFFNYFGSKENLIVMIIKDGMEELKEKTAEVRENVEDPFEAIREATSFQINATVKYKNITCVFYHMVLQNDELKPLKREFDETFCDAMMIPFDRGQLKTDIAREDIRDMLVGAFSSVMMSRTSEYWKEDISNALEHILRIINKV